jgi:trans-aconitate methyltransferase
MSGPPIRVSGDWLALRERADAAARSRELVEQLLRAVPESDPWSIHDLACGTGGMGRWLAPQLSGPQHWVLHDLDDDLLALAAADPPPAARDGSAVTVEPRRSDITHLQAGELAGATLITASALLDLLTESELEGLVAVCAAAACPILLALSVAGWVELSPPDPLDHRVAAAFDAHQRRATERGRLLGPDAPAAAAEAFGRLGAEVLTRPSPWRLRARDAELTAEWFSGWVAAAREQDAELAVATDAYVAERLAQSRAGQLQATVDHADLLILHAGQSRSKRDESA